MQGDWYLENSIGKHHTLLLEQISSSHSKGWKRAHPHKEGREGVGENESASLTA